MKNSLWLAMIGVIVVLAGIILLVNSGSAPVNGQAVNYGSGEVQKITLSFKDYNYYPNTITVKAGQPVELTLDSKVTGCFRAFTLRELGISQYAKTPSDTITFTLPRAGTFAFSCSMGMGSGTFKAI